jgi:putative oxidoreductase
MSNVSKKVVAALTPFAPLPVRFGAGLTLLLHGWPRLADMSAWIERVDHLGLPRASVLAWVLLLPQVLGGLLLILGLYTRVAAFFCLLAVSVELFLGVHGGLGGRFFADRGGPELALLLALMLLGALLGGSGRASVDSIRGKL